MTVKKTWEFDDYDESDLVGDDDPPDLGTCCACGKAGPEVINVVMLSRRCLTPGKGWGCLQCGLPMDGATAVLCTPCLESQAEIKWACDGYPKDNVRVPLAELDPTPFDHDLSKHPEAQEYPAMSQSEPEIIEVHQAWTIYGMNSDGTEAEQKIVELGTRPQDWGDPRWHYERYRFEWLTAPDGKQYIHHAHCWTDLKREPHDYAALFASLIIMFSWPGRPEQLCGRDYLREEDFWEEAWGEMPPIFQEEHDDYGWGDDHP